MASRSRSRTAADPDATALAILGQYGGVITESDASKVLGFRSRDGFRRAIEVGRLPIRMFVIPGRRGRWVVFTDLADALDSINTPAPIETAPAPPEPAPPRTQRRRAHFRPIDLTGITDDRPADDDPVDLREFDLVRRHTPRDSDYN